MDAPATVKTPRINRLLPYWAVLQEDVRQTLRSWIYRTWVLISILTAVGYLLYRVGVYREAGMVQLASTLMGDLLRWSVLGSVTLIIALTAGSISADRGTLGDSVLCRGISRYQYFLAKWHARLFTILTTFFIMSLLMLACSFVLLRDDLSLMGSLAAMCTVAVLLAAVITCGVTFSAITNSTVMGIAALWLFIYGVGFTLTLLPPAFPSPDQALHRLPNMLSGKYDWNYLAQLTMWSALLSLGIGLVGVGYFAQRDV